MQKIGVRKLIDNKIITQNTLRCPKCHGKLYVDSDQFGKYETCANCGYLRDIETQPKDKPVRITL